MTEESLGVSRRRFIEASLAGGAVLWAERQGAEAQASENSRLLGHAASEVKRDELRLAASGAVALEGWLGSKIDLCVTQRVMKQSVAEIVSPFRERKDGDGGWRGEFWGKWFTSAVLGYEYRPTLSHRAVLDEGIRQLLLTQDADGYLGTCDAQHQLADWDIWGRKYVLLGLLAYFDQTGNADALTAARREMDFLMTQVGPGRTNIVEACIGVLKGLSPSSILEPVVLLYDRTGDKKYLRFAEYIVGQWSRPSKYAPQGMMLVEGVLAGKAPPEIDAPKGYEMMSCFEGLCELYRVTGEPRYLDAVTKFSESVAMKEVMVNGSCSNQELWCDGAVTQTTQLEQPQETCVTATWMKLCGQLLRLTGDSRWADRMEVSLYNALAGAIMPDGRWWAYFSPLTGQRVASEIQYVNLSCCVANGPRALLLTPRWAVMESDSGPVVNLYVPGTMQCRLAAGGTVRLTQETTYPVAGGIRIRVDPAQKARFSLRLRIPAWSAETTLMMNGETVTCTAGTYVSLERDWHAGDVVELQLDLAARAVKAPSGAPEFAVMRGPIVLALDNRFSPAQEVAVHLVVDGSQRVMAQEKKLADKNVWMAFDVTYEVRPSHFFGHHPISLTMVDFASAGNRWADDNVFRTWLPQPLFLGSAYPEHTWKTMFPESKARPEEQKTA